LRGCRTCRDHQHGGDRGSSPQLALQLEAPEYRVRTELDPLPGPETAFRMCVLGHRQPQSSLQPLPEVEERVAAVIPGIPSHELNQFLSKVKKMEYALGDLIIREGDVAEEFTTVGSLFRIRKALTLESQENEEQSANQRISHRRAQSGQRFHLSRSVYQAYACFRWPDVICSLSASSDTTNARER
jgi:hypothetical protein